MPLMGFIMNDYALVMHTTCANTYFLAVVRKCLKCFGEKSLWWWWGGGRRGRGEMGF